MFTYHDTTTAPEASRPFLEQVQASFGFVPNLHRILAESPAAHEAYATLYRLSTEQTGLTPLEAQIVMMVANYHNRCHYCMAGHSMIMTMLKAPQDVIDALRDNAPLADEKLEALRTFTLKLLEQRGHVGDDAVVAFLDAGYTKANVLDVLVCLATKLISNFTNAVVHTELDEPAKAMAWTPPA